MPVFEINVNRRHPVNIDVTCIGATLLIDQTLVNDIAAVFPLEPIPSNDDIARCTYDKKNGGSYSGPCSDCSEIAEFFACKRWNQPSAIEYRRFGDATSLMTQSAFNYFLPGWMTASIIDRLAADVVPDYLISTMSGRSEYKANRIEECYNYLIDSQLNCVKRFINWYHGDENWVDKDVVNALERIDRRVFVNKTST